MKRGERVKKVGKVSRLRASAEESSAPEPGQGDAKRIYKPLKKRLTLRLDADVLAWFKKQGRGYQTRINQALSAWVREQKTKTLRGSVAHSLSLEMKTAESRPRLQEGYRAMAADELREREAQQWCEGLILPPKERHARLGKENRRSKKQNRESKE